MIRVWCGRDSGVVRAWNKWIGDFSEAVIRFWYGCDMAVIPATIWLFFGCDPSLKQVDRRFLRCCDSTVLWLCYGGGADTAGICAWYRYDSIFDPSFGFMISIFWSLARIWPLILDIRSCLLVSGSYLAFDFEFMISIFWSLALIWPLISDL